MKKLPQETSLAAVTQAARFRAMHSKAALVTEFQRLMTKTDWTKADAARALGLHPSMVVRYMKPIAEATPPSITVLKLFSRTTGIPLLLPGEQHDPFLNRDVRGALEQWETDAIGVMRRVDPERRRECINAVRALIDAIRPSTVYPEPQAPRSSSEMIKALAAEIAELAEDSLPDDLPATSAPQQSIQKERQTEGTADTTGERIGVDSQRRSIADGVGQKRSHPRRGKS